MQLNTNVILDETVQPLRDAHAPREFNIFRGLCTEVVGRVKTRVMDARTGRCVRETPFQKNLILDVGLNSLARKAGGPGVSVPATVSTYCKIGSGNNPNSIASGAVTISQTASATAVASAGFFTAAMVGGILKYGTGSGGLEVYITAFTDSTHVTTDTNTTQGASVATVWQVQQTALQTQAFDTNTYQTNSGDCQTTFTANAVTLQRTYINGVQASPYNVNEIGYGPIAGATIAGRFVLGSTDVVGTTNFYVVVISLTFTYSPGAPSAVADVGTGMSTAGNAMVEFLGSAVMATVGSTGAAGATGIMDQTCGNLRGSTATYTQNSTVQATGSLVWGTNITMFASTATWTNNSAVRGQMKATFNYSVATSGQTLFGFGFCQATAPCFDIKLTASVTLPTGTFSGTAVYSIIYGRTLTN